MKKTFKKCFNHPSFRPAVKATREQLSVVHKVRVIRPGNLDAASWIPSTAAGYGYTVPKRDNYL